MREAFKLLNVRYEERTLSKASGQSQAKEKHSGMLQGLWSSINRWSKPTAKHMCQGKSQLHRYTHTQVRAQRAY